MYDMKIIPNREWSNKFARQRVEVVKIIIMHEIINTVGH